jgi:C. elegans Sre G protein-coupled chemoreceptor
VGFSSRYVSPFMWTDLAWLEFIMLGALLLPVGAVERTCATWCVADYEVRQRRWLSTLLSTSANVAAGAMALYYKFGRSVASSTRSGIMKVE